MNTKIKKILAVLLAALLIFGLSACKKDKDEGDGTPVNGGDNSQYTDQSKGDKDVFWGKIEGNWNGSSSEIGTYSAVFTKSGDTYSLEIKYSNYTVNGQITLDSIATDNLQASATWLYTSTGEDLLIDITSSSAISLSYYDTTQKADVSIELTK